jgi:hypothetical protein
MSMVHLTKGQIRMVNLIKPYLVNLANLTKPFWWTFVHFDQIFDLTLGQKGHFSQMY